MHKSHFRRGIETACYFNSNAVQLCPIKSGTCCTSRYSLVPAFLLSEGNSGCRRQAIGIWRCRSEASQEGSNGDLEVPLGKQWGFGGAGGKPLGKQWGSGGAGGKPLGKQWGSGGARAGKKIL